MSIEPKIIAAIGLLVLVAVCLALSDRALLAAYTLRRDPRWEIGGAFQPGRWGLSLLLSLYKGDRGIALFVGPFYLYLLLGADQ